MIKKEEIVTQDLLSKYRNDYNEEVDDNVNELLKRINIIRALYGKPMTLSSGWRPSEYNKSIGGAPNSNHCKGLALDVKDTDGEFKKFVTSNLYKFSLLGLYMEQFSWTPTWVHIQIVPPASGARFFEARGDKLPPQPHLQVIYNSGFNRDAFIKTNKEKIEKINTLLQSSDTDAILKLIKE